mgnify:CR=1 FL=1
MHNVYTPPASKLASCSARDISIVAPGRAYNMHERLFLSMIDSSNRRSKVKAAMQTYAGVSTARAHATHSTHMHAWVYFMHAPFCLRAPSSLVMFLHGHRWWLFVPYAPVVGGDAGESARCCSACACAACADAHVPMLGPTPRAQPGRPHRYLWA